MRTRKATAEPPGATIELPLQTRAEVRVMLETVDAEAINREIAADNARADALGLVLDTDPRRVNRTGAAQFNDESAGEEDDSELEAVCNRESDVA